ncbi:phosphotransferase [Streptomyces litchfieldiae]|uniref:Phosphotransferase n=1 Tax=Streptomyces litchfieldiae TaxID=3075543 RepID=A0ABU2MR84_9ACTN|nr:phosphotransferase [Streptomyces sp. DSM 44938]MDT0344133.1 phosphotransferase [Streptomyces sp. DSM 44938]
MADGEECVIHGDPGLNSTVFRDGMPTALIDWDGCRPGRRLDDLAYMAWSWCILERMPIPITRQATLLRELHDGYGDFEPEPLLDAMVERQTEVADAETRILHDPGHTPERRAHALTAVEWATACRALVLQHRPLLLSALR